MNEKALKRLNLARGLAGIGNKDEAIHSYRAVLEHQPDCLDAKIELGFLLWELGRLDDAASIAVRLIRENPDHAAGYFLNGHCLVEKGDINHAIESYQRLSKISAPKADSYHALALAYKEGGCFEEARSAYNLALSLSPDSAEIRNNKAILSLLLGDYNSGLVEYESRKDKRERFGDRDFIQPRWLGEDLSGKTLLIHHEQGMGDAIQFSRYIKLLQEKGVNVLYDAHPPLRGLLSSMCDLVFVDSNNASLRFDYHCPLLSLPLRLGTTVETIPAQIPYLYAEAQRVETWRKKIGTHGFKIGVAWQGSRGRFAKNRQFSASFLKPLKNIAGVRLIGLHKAPMGAEWELPDGLQIETLGPDFDVDSHAFLDAAAVIECCDLIISCDTAIAHLTGAIGKPLWLVLKHIPHWIWMMDRNDSPWYPTARLFRQKSPGDWSSAFSEVYFELARVVSSES